jgi:L-iditol 2-dehydrogenase|tara:strand:- start:640 stop:1683 length:1044 start_codon:yes stop_codon:yes gene_type:complete
MRALVRYSHLPKKLKVKNIPFPEIKNSKKHAIIKVKYTGICGRDLEHFKSKISKKKVPSVLGHEFSGVVKKIYKNKFNIKIGDRVTCETVNSVCGKCNVCKNGFYNLCKKRKNIGGGETGAFASHIKVPYQYIHKLPKNVSLDEAALIEPLAVSYNALISNSEIKKNSSVLIFGAGTIGLLSLKIAHFKKAKIFLVCTPKDKIQKKIAIKNKVSKIYFNNIDYVKKILDDTNQEGVDLIVDTVGGIDQTFEDSIKLAKPGGQITKIGWFMKKNVVANFDDIVRKNLKIQGSFSHNYKIWEKCIKLLSNKNINIKDLISKKCEISEWKNAFDLLTKRKAVKILMSSNE